MTAITKTCCFIASNAESAKKTSAQEKAQARRAQVRKAQIQHRQRKENYVKQLEMDVAELRASIAKAQEETQAIMRENDAIRAQIRSQAAAASSNFLATSPNLAVTPRSVPGGPGSAAASEMDLALDLGFKLDPQDLDDITMSLAFDEAMGLPSYRVSNSPSSHYSTPNTAPLTPDPTAPAGCSLTPSQTQEAINFILALEHNCRDHFLPSYNEPSTDDPSAIETGHVLMATSLGLRTAPDPVFREAARTGRGPWSPVQRPDLYNDGINIAAPVEPIAWQAPDLTLQNLYGLACAVNSASELEITPVQAWFELADRFPMEVLLRKDVLEALKREFVGVVKCPHYGAQIERGAFESIVGRVLGSVM
ncbi:hypothetical protein B0H67DRAFT_82294 [Lasiosphaeris hirsuta]|uniref:BZIP domain-containing protein n=1 Tax=Lasiosphaeris hirsuta TaxID=260670 RepID=A0AA40BCK4_9PEZI|nr:hypothetical protein B0H67DRAFT_82294 [Lasiosphaeris hirsuta]